MNTTIIFKPVLLNKHLKWLVIIGLVICVVLFLFLKIDLSYRYFLCMLIIFMGLLIVFYNNKNEPEKIIIEGDRIEFSFFNKVFFKKEDCVFKKQNLRSQVKESVIELFDEDRIVSNIRKISLSSENWETLKVYLTKN